jgi:hypothetical protein
MSLSELWNFSSKRAGFYHPPKFMLLDDEQNSKKVFGTTAYYNPEAMQVVVYTTGRHIKDVLRSISHELIHHFQNLEGKLQGEQFETGDGYAQKNPYMRKLEREAFLSGNMTFRDFENSFEEEIMTENKKWKDKIAGGLADKKTPEDYDKKDLEKGEKVEMEHTDDPDIAKEIAQDHIEEFDSYYDELEKMEDKLEDDITECKRESNISYYSRLEASLIKKFTRS